MMRFKFLLPALLLSAVIFAQQKSPAFWKEIQQFQKQDSLHPPAFRQIVFTGSSSFTLWKDVQAAFPEQAILNRAFGGSSLPDVIRYVDEVIIKYAPKQVVIYCGENDLAASDTVSAKMVASRFKELFTRIRKRLPGVPLVFISIKPSPSRWHMQARVVEANALIQKFLKKKKKAAFVNVYDSMLNADGSPREELFVQDRLHMNAKGYSIWQTIIAPYLLK
jgi:lysophospholipase L1-like esterase